MNERGVKAAVLFYRPGDQNIHKFFKGGGNVDEARFEQVAGVVHREGGPVTPEELRGRTALSKTRVARAISRLEEAGALETLPGGEVAPSGAASGLREESGRAARMEATRGNESRSLRLFPLQTRVMHKEWGKGMVERYENGKVEVLFDDPAIGRKSLFVEAVLERKLLEPAA